ncbi:MAG: hypothetical protein RIT45_3657 [Pseudomonadota bacterium]|jgi:putative phosphoesterase
MRIGLLSDVHATPVALDAVLAALDAAGVDQIVCLGDVVDMGPEPNATVERLRERGIPTLLGNHDTLDEAPGFPILADIERWTAETLRPEHRAWLDALPMTLTIEAHGLRLLCTHGTPRDNHEGIVDATPWTTLRDAAGAEPFDVLAAGHTHVQLLRRDGAQTVVNVGSAAQPFARPFDGSPPSLLPCCDFAVVELGPGGVDVALRRIPLPWEPFVASMRASAMPHVEAMLGQWSRAY